jgi:hypothetical protein
VDAGCLFHHVLAGEIVAALSKHSDHGLRRYDQQGRAAQEIEALWSWTRAQCEGTPSEMLVDNHPSRQAAA